MADKCAKKATKMNRIDITVPFSKTEIKVTIKHKLKERWKNSGKKK